MDQPVVPTYPTIWPRSTCCARADDGRRHVVVIVGEPDAVVEAVVDDDPVAPGGLEVAAPSPVPAAAARIGVPQAAPKSMPSCSDAVAVDRVDPPAERRGDRAVHRVVQEAVGVRRAAVAERAAGLARRAGRRPRPGAEPVGALRGSRRSGRAPSPGPAAGPGRRPWPWRPPAGRRAQRDQVATCCLGGLRPAPRGPACARRFSAAALRCLATSTLASSTSLLLHGEQRARRLELVEHDRLLVDDVLHGVQLAGELGGVLRGEHHRQAHQRRVAGLVVLHHDLGRASAAGRRLLAAGWRGRRGPAASRATAAVAAWPASACRAPRPPRARRGSGRAAPARRRAGLAAAASAAPRAAQLRRWTRRGRSVRAVRSARCDLVLLVASGRRPRRAARRRAPSSELPTAAAAAERATGSAGEVANHRSAFDVSGEEAIRR